MSVISDEAQWAQMTFGQAKLGDQRRTARLVRLAGDLAVSPELSVDAACLGDEAAAEGAHRLMRNDAVKAQAIAESGFEATAKLAEGTTGWILAIEDTTTLSFTHSVAGQLGDMGGVANARPQGWWVHSVLLAEAESRAPIGLIDQERWTRPTRSLIHCPACFLPGSRTERDRDDFVEIDVVQRRRCAASSSMNDKEVGEIIRSSRREGN
jgi:hypothetical protein